MFGAGKITRLRTGQTGLVAIAILIMLIALSVAGFAGWRVYEQRRADGKVATVSTPVLHSFSECVKANGTVRTLTSSLSGTPLPDYDLDAETLHCQYGHQSFPARLDTRCQKLARCEAAKQAARAACDSYPVANRQPVFKYHPVLKDDFAKLQLTACGTGASFQDAPLVVILKSSDQLQLQWRILRIIDTHTTCKDLDHQSIPLELVYACLEPGVGFRPVQ